MDTDEIESWVSQDLFEKRASVETVSELDYCRIGMTEIVMGDVNAVYTLECAHRRLLLAARTLNERSLLIRGLPFPRTKTIGDVFFDDLFILSVLKFSNVLFHRQWKCSEPMLCTISSRCLRMRASQAVHSPENSGSTTRRRFRHAWIPS